MLVGNSSNALENPQVNKTKQLTELTLKTECHLISDHY